MNKKIETTKIKVSNGQELITKAQEYKNSGGDWKLLEKYFTGPAKGDIKEREFEWGIIIGNGSQRVDIKSVNNNWVKGKKVDNEDSEGSKFLTNALDMNEVWDELCQIFPKVAPARSSKKENQSFPLKKIQKNGKEYLLGRYLVAENSWHLKQILHEYVRENETKIYQSANPHFSGWVEIVDGQDGNIYLYVGEKNSGGGREIKIGIKKSEFYSQPNHNFYVKKGGGTYSHEEMLELNWNLFTITRPMTSTEEKEYYSHNGGLEQEWQRNWPHHEKLCQKYLEDLRERLNKRLEYWKKQPNNLSGEMCMLTTTIVYIDHIDGELEKMKNKRPVYYAACDKDCDMCGMKLCCHYEGQACSESKKNVNFDKEITHNHGLSPEQPKENKDKPQLTDKEKSELLSLFQKYNIKKIIWENDQLTIEYNNSQNENKEVNKQELEKYQKFIENSAGHTISLSDLQKKTTTDNSQPDNKNNNKLVIGLVVGAIVVVVIGVLVYFTRKEQEGENK